MLMTFLAISFEPQFKINLYTMFKTIELKVLYMYHSAHSEYCFYGICPSQQLISAKITFQIMNSCETDFS